MKDPVKIRAEKSNINEEIAKEWAEWLGGAEMAEKMKKCPFCGGEPQMLKGFIKGITMIVCIIEARIEHIGMIGGADNG